MIRPASPGRRARALVQASVRMVGRRFVSDRARERSSDVEGMGLRREPIVDIGAILPPRVLLAAAVAVAAAALFA
jgi:hypothetical protein